MSIGCGKQINCLVVKNGSLFTWGKGEHEKPKHDDYKEYSSPFPMLEEKHLVYVSCGLSHVMAIDSTGRLYGWGDGRGCCLGLGD
jgi:alpha-tubulin suppressor-like RCC1 family protein